MSLDKAKAQVFEFERGKYVPKLGDRNNDPNPTMNGVIQRTYDRYRDGRNCLRQSVYLITQDEWDDIFVHGFWEPAGCPDLPEPLDMLVADCAFNSGPKQSVKFLQRAVGAIPDGVWGPDTKKRTLQANVREVCISVIGQRIRFLRSLYDKSIVAGKEWDGLPETEKARAARPEPFPLESLLHRVADLQKAAGF